VDDGALEVGEGPLPGADRLIEVAPSLHPLLTRGLGMADALANGIVRPRGRPELFEGFVDVFDVPPVPVTLPA